jgi:DNA-binding PadR family transcriptional regulator
VSKGQAKPSPKEVVLLGLISEEPIHAWGIEAKMRERHMDEWTEMGFSSIYRVLAGLEKKGFIETRLEHEGQGATRKVHRVTAAGLEVLVEGVLTYLQDVLPLKNPLWVGLTYMLKAEREEVLDRLGRRLEAYRGFQEHLRSSCERHEVEARKGTDDGSPEPWLLPVQLLFDNIGSHVDAEIAFLERSLARLDSDEARTTFAAQRTTPPATAGADVDARQGGA